MKRVNVVLSNCNQVIDTIEVADNYTAVDYITDCESNGIDTSSWYETGLELREVEA